MYTIAQMQQKQDANAQLKRSAPNAAVETAAAATVEPESVPAARPQYHDTLLRADSAFFADPFHQARRGASSAAAAAAEPEDRDGFPQDQIEQATINSLKEHTKTPAPRVMAAAGEVSAKAPAEDASAQPEQR
jgi:hypothetical protein